MGAAALCRGCDGSVSLGESCSATVGGGGATQWKTAAASVRAGVTNSLASCPTWPHFIGLPSTRGLASPAPTIHATTSPSPAPASATAATAAADVFRVQRYLPIDEFQFGIEILKRRY